MSIHIKIQIGFRQGRQARIGLRFQFRFHDAEISQVLLTGFWPKTEEVSSDQPLFRDFSLNQARTENSPHLVKDPETI